MYNLTQVINWWFDCWGALFQLYKQAPLNIILRIILSLTALRFILRIIDIFRNQTSNRI